MLDVSDFKKLSTWAIVLPLIGILGFGIDITYQLEHRLPDLETRQNKIDSRQDRLDSGLRDDMKAMSVEVREQLKAVSATLLSMKANMMRLCSYQKKPLTQACDVQALVVDAESMSRIQAQFVDTASVHLSPGEATPRVASLIKDRLPAITWTQGITGFHPELADKPKIADVILWSSAAEAAQWHQEGNTLKVHFANGEASFDMVPGAKKHAAELVESLNATADVFRTDFSKSKAPPRK